MTSYNAVPPPPLEEGKEEEESRESAESKREAVKEGERRQEKPAHVSGDHWKRFMQLKARRERQSGKSTQKRIDSVKRSALRAVRREVTVEDIEDVLNNEGLGISLSLPSKQQSSDTCHLREGPSKQVVQVWQEVKDHMDCSPQLRGPAEHQKQTTKSGLEEQLDKAVEEGRFECATQLSEQLAQRELAVRVSTAIDRYKHTKRTQHEKEIRTSKKPKLLWRFERKERWETKGNM